MRENPQRQNVSGAWGYEKGWRWLSREQFDETCMHGRQLGQRLFHHRQIRYVSCNICKARAIIRRGLRGGPAKAARPEVVIARGGALKKIYG